MPNALTINPQKETKHIISFLKSTLKKQDIYNVVLGFSGGIDSTTSLFLLKNAIPATNIHVVHMPYYLDDKSPIEGIIKMAGIPQKQLHIVSIKEPVDALQRMLAIGSKETKRLGNVMARVRMITLFDFAKKLGGLVCGTENKSEHYLSYFTRFGDEASDIEPIRHLYKTQVYELARHLGVPDFVIQAKPTAGLWEGQTDEKEFGFSYKEADQVLLRYFEKEETLASMQKNYPNAKRIIEWVKENDFKHYVPYTL